MAKAGVSYLEDALLRKFDGTVLTGAGLTGAG